MKYLLPLLVLIVFTFCYNRNELYDSNATNVINLNNKNFETQINQNRAKNVISIVHYYTLEDGKSKAIKEIFDTLARDYEGMFKVAAMNCKEFKNICEKNEIREYPSIKVYPSLPAPVFNYDGKIEVANIVSYLGSFMNSKVQELNNNNIDNFIGSNVNLPKTILFTDKKGIPLVFKALSVTFDKKIEFGIVRSDDSGITQKYKIKTFPKIMAIGTDKKQKFFEGDNKYKPIFEFMNVFSETFFVVGEDKLKPSEITKQDKPWLNEKLPELTKESSNEVCFRVDGIICVILVNKEKPSEELINQFVSLQNWLSPKIDRGGIKYRFGWISSTTQTQFAKSVDLAAGAGPHLLLVNPGKRKRYYVLEGELKEDNMRAAFDKLASGDIKFKLFKGNEIPDLE